jgi:hypothetical protein
MKAALVTVAAIAFLGAMLFYINLRISRYRYRKEQEAAKRRRHYARMKGATTIVVNDKDGCHSRPIDVNDQTPVITYDRAEYMNDWMQGKWSIDTSGSRKGNFQIW